MQKYAGAVIPMQQNTNYFFHCGTESTLNTIRDVPSLHPFSEDVISYLDDVAKLLLKNALSKQYPDVITFAFWCRRASTMKMSAPYRTSVNRMGRGVVFHIAPSNVPVNFAYSLAVGLLAGNANIVRVPSKQFEQIGIIVKAFESAFDTHPQMRSRIILLRYGHDQNVTDRLSSLCDVRIIWGGDNTIAAIRASPLLPRATDIVFADRYSFCIINADAYLASGKPEQLAQDFYNDTYLNDQNACTSPQLIIWIGTKRREAKELFWTTLHKLVQKKYDLKPVQAVGKLSAACRISMKYDVTIVPAPDNDIVRIQIKQLSPELMDYKYHSGFFLEYDAQSIDEMNPMCTEKCQTISYYGVPEDLILSCILHSGKKGVDRIVPVGKTLDFDLTWDGYDLMERLTRIVAIR